MDDSEKKAYLEKYKDQKEKGVPFFPDIIFKDVVVTLIVFLILIALTYFVGAPLDARADPADTSYTPRPEWYFLFLFQLLKYFPGNLEVIGVVVIPTIAIILLFLLPLIDRSPRRYYRQRPLITGLAALSVVGFIYLTVQSVREAPPPAEISGGDQTAALYTSNCAGCHGTSIKVQPGTNLHNIIAQGKHESMPAWNADLTSDQIDALAGFILSPGGSQLFTQNCANCHEVSELVSSNPLELKNALDEGEGYPPHSQVEIPDWNSNLSPEDKTSLLNFLIAPDGQRLFTIYCSPCHGQSVAFAGDQTQLNEIISKGGLHLEMPPWREKLSEADIQLLSQYVVDPSSTPNGQSLFKENCASCHGERIPTADNVEQAQQIITNGGEHQTMPIWGDILTSAQLSALVDYTLQTSEGSSLEQGQELFNQYCSACHGEFGEGGPNPSRPSDVIPPISTSEYLKTRDDYTLSAIISQGQPNLGMSPFGSTNGGPLSDDEISTIVNYIRSWQANPPVELPPEINADTLPLKGADIYQEVCAQCHGPNGEGGVGPALASTTYQSDNTDQQIFDAIDLGHPATPMIAWGEILSDQQITELVNFIRQFKLIEPTATTAAPATTEEAETPSSSATPEATATPETPSTPEAGEAPSFTNDIMPIFEDKCIMCHGTLGGWDASSYEKVMTTGDNAPVVIPGDADNSLLAIKILGQQTEGMIMPPVEKLSQDSIDLIINWIKAGAPDN
jgi:mono/diheme cytochrome c family protein